MVDENPLEQLHEELETHETADEKRVREETERHARESSEREKRGEEIRAIDSKLTKLQEDISTWQTQTSSALEKMAETFQQSTRAALETLAAKPSPVEPQNPPAPVSPETASLESDGDDHPAAKTARKPAGKKLRFL